MKDKIIAAISCSRRLIAEAAYDIRKAFRAIPSPTQTNFFFASCILFCIVASSCKKNLKNDLLPNNIAVSNDFNFPFVNFDSITIPFKVCILSYNHLVAELRGSSILVQAVVLDDGTRINTGNGITTMIYRTIKIKEDYSLFRSEFQVVYNFYGYQQENSSNCWSLGCAYLNSGTAPFTNIRKGSKLLMINTHFIWSVPGQAGKDIKYLVVN